jgi:hypothetical protein
MDIEALPYIYYISSIFLSYYISLIFLAILTYLYDLGKSFNA